MTRVKHRTQAKDAAGENPSAAFGFAVQASDGEARCGLLRTAHGTVASPAFMPVGTAGAVKALHPQSVAESGAEMILANTWHLMLRPGAEVIAGLGGLRNFMGWHGPILTDSGGFQAMSLQAFRRISEEGLVCFSHIDGSRHHLTPEYAMSLQRDFDSTIAMVLDECVPYSDDRAAVDASMQRSMRWAARSKQAYDKRAKPGHAVFGIVQGGIFAELRRDSAFRLQEIGFPGYAIGGLAVGEGQAALFKTLEATIPHLPEDKPRYLMGVGTVPDLLGAVRRGVDLFDCVLPTRAGRTGQALTQDGPVNLRNARYRNDKAPLDEDCPCPACRRFSKAYLRHLVKSREILGSMLLSEHNLVFYQQVMRRLRDAIEERRFQTCAQAILDRYQGATS